MLGRHKAETLHGSLRYSKGLSQTGSGNLLGTRKLPLEPLLLLYKSGWHAAIALLLPVADTPLSFCRAKSLQRIVMAMADLSYYTQRYQ